ncbi:MAG TPA: c-type cytochrome [Thermoanaerobaculia bacterium]|nr:c-type cytochrome [Thermoanaerobaculia bacterium]
MSRMTGVAAAVLGACLLAGPVRAEGPGRSSTWEAYCTVCHGPDGKSNTEEGKKRNARDLTDPRWLASVSDSRLEGSIRRGRDKMPAFGRKLGNEQIKALVAEIRALTPK